MGIQTSIFRRPGVGAIVRQWHSNLSSLDCTIPSLRFQFLTAAIPARILPSTIVHPASTVSFLGYYLSLPSRPLFQLSMVSLITTTTPCLATRMTSMHPACPPSSQGECHSPPATASLLHSHRVLAAPRSSCKHYLALDTAAVTPAMLDGDWPPESASPTCIGHCCRVKVIIPAYCIPVCCSSAYCIPSHSHCLSSI